MIIIFPQLFFEERTLDKESMEVFSEGWEEETVWIIEEEEEIIKTWIHNPIWDTPYPYLPGGFYEVLFLQGETCW